MPCLNSRLLAVFCLLLAASLECEARQKDPTLFWFPEKQPPQQYVQLPLPCALKTPLTKANLVSLSTLPSKTTISIARVSEDLETPLFILDTGVAIPETDRFFLLDLANLTDECGASRPVKFVGPIVRGSNLEKYTADLLKGMVQTQSGRPVDSVTATTAILDPHTVGDTFGRRIARRFVVFQVTIANLDENFQFLIHDLSLDIPYRIVPAGSGATTGTPGQLQNPVLQPCPPWTAGCESAVVSSIELSILRGVAEKGQLSSPRNMVLRALKGAGTLGAAVIGIPTSLGPSYAPAIAGFNGPLISAYENVFPDFTINQVNRLNDSAHAANRLIARQQARVVTGFVSQALLFSAADSKQFWKDPYSRLGNLLGARVSVRGTHIVDLEDVPPLVTNVTFADPMNRFQGSEPAVKGFVIGQFLNNATLDLTKKPDGVTLEIDGEPQNARIDFIVRSDRPVPPGTILEFAISKGETVTKHSVTLDYQAGQPVIESLSPAGAAPGAGEVEVTVSGENFFQGRTVVNVTGLELAGAAEIVSPTELKIKLKIPDSAKPGDYPVAVTAPGGASVPKNFRVWPPITLKPNQAARGAGNTTVTVTGEGFADGQTQVTVEGLEPPGDPEFVSATELRINLNIGADAPIGRHAITVKTGLSSPQADFTVVEQ